MPVAGASSRCVFFGISFSTCDVPIDSILTFLILRDAKVQASTVYGAYHALQTLSQLITFDFDTKLYSVSAAPWLITDAPRFSHREILVDTSRHWQPLPKLVGSRFPFTRLLSSICESPPFLIPSPARNHRQSHTSQTQRDPLAHCRFPIFSLRVQDLPGAC